MKYGENRLNTDTDHLRGWLAAIGCVLMLWSLVCLPAQATMRVDRHAGSDGYLERVVIENPHVGVEIDSIGGKLTRLWHPQTGRQWIAPGDTIMQGAAKRRDWVTGNSELLTAAHDLTVHHDPQVGTVVVEAAYEASTGNFAGLAFTMRYTLSGDSPAIQVHQGVRAQSEQTQFTLNTHNLLTLDGLPAQNTWYFARSTDGPVRLPLMEAQRQRHNVIYNPAQPWAALGDTASGQGLAFYLDNPQMLDYFYLWAGTGAATVEWTHGRADVAPVAERDHWEADYTIVPYTGLGNVLGVGPDLLYGIDQDQQQGVVTLFSPAGQDTAHVTVSFNGKTLAARQVDLPAGQAAAVRFPLPQQAGEHQVQVAVNLSQSQVTFAAPVAVDGQVRYAGVSHTLRQQEIEGVNGFYYYYPSLSVSPDLTVPISFGLRGRFVNKPALDMVLELPDYVAFEAEREPGLQSEAFERDGVAYRRYRVASPRKQTYYAALAGYVSLKRVPETLHPAYLYADWGDGQQPAQVLPLHVVRVQQPPQLEHIQVGLELSRLSLVSRYPDLAASFRQAGLNYLAGGIASWSLSAEDRREKGAYADFVNQIEQAGITVSTGNLGYPFPRPADLWNGRYRVYERAATHYYPSETYEDFDVEDTRAVNLHGRPMDQMCPSYRGRYFQKVLDNVRLLIDYGYTRLLYDEETWSYAREICYCPRCLAGFVEFLASRYPQLEPRDARQIAAAPDDFPELYAAWWDYRTDLVADIYAQMKQTAVDHGGPGIEIATYIDPGVPSRSRGTRGGGSGVFQGYGAITNRMTDYGKIAAVTDFVLPMAYTTSMLDNRRVGDVAAFLWQQSRGKMARPYMALSPHRTYEYDRVVRHTLPPAVAIKYQLYESFAAGIVGILIWAPPSGLEGAASYGYMADAIRTIAPVESVVVDGQAMEELSASNRRVHVRGMQKDGRSVVLVAEYSTSSIRTDVQLAAAARDRTVTDLETGQLVASLPAGQTAFEVSLDDQRARLLLVE